MVEDVVEVDAAEAPVPDIDFPADLGPLADPDSVESRLLMVLGEAAYAGLLSWRQVAHIHDLVDRDADLAEELERMGGTWRPVDVRAVLAGDVSPLESTQLARADGVCLLYPGRVHDFHGPPEVLKSWLAQVAAAEALRAGGSALYIDFEGEARDVVGHLRLLGVNDEDLVDRLLYVRPEEPFGDEARIALLSKLAKRRPAITVLDGVNNAMAASGFEPNSNLDVRKWWERLVRPVQLCTDGATVLVDHVAKDSESRGQWAVGAGQKLAGIDGASFGFSLVQPFGRGRTGIARILLHKDRPGRLRGEQGADKEIARLRLVSHDDGMVSYELHRPADPAAPPGTAWQPTTLMQRVSETLEEAHDPLSKAQIEAKVEGRREYIRKALIALIEGGFVSVVKGPRNGILHRSDKPFRAPSSDLAPTSPDLAHDTAGRGEGDLARQGALPLGRPNGARVDSSPISERPESPTSPGEDDDPSDGDYPADLAELEVASA